MVEVQLSPMGAVAARARGFVFRVPGFARMTFTATLRTLSASVCLAWVLFLSAEVALAQSTPRIFDVEFGTPVTQLSSDKWVEPSCGTNGGPPSTRLTSFQEFARCPVESQTGLREVWFIYDDEWEYIARAYGDPGEILRYSANVFFRQPIITSLLIDDNGLVRGYRVITDPRAPDELRLEAHLLLAVFQTMFTGAPWQCEDIPPAERQSPVNGLFVNSRCALASEQLYVKIEASLLRKPGQANFVNPRPSYFEGSARLEVYDLATVTGQPCCPGSLRP